MSMDRLLEKIAEYNNPTVVGLDPKLDYVPAFLKEQANQANSDPLSAAAEAILAFNKGLIDALFDIVPAVKPQAAYYELYGWQGMKALKETIDYAREKGMSVIVDGKRNDIGSTMEAYANAYLGLTTVGSQTAGAFSGDCLTVNGYLGTDGIAPLLECCRIYDKGIFVLVKTSNPSSGELQDLNLKDSDQTIYETMGNMCELWGKQAPGKYGYSSVGAVVGATYPRQLQSLRRQMPHTFFLVPGYGAQGGTAQDIRFAFDQNGLGAIINSSRNIITAYQKSNGPGEDFAKKAREEALRMRDEIRAATGEIRLPAL